MDATDPTDETGAGTEGGVLTAEDLVPDRALAQQDNDKFRHEPIAKRLGELVRTGDAPLNVALFGPWGSGKSSVYELLRRELEPHAKEAKLVRYDAWKYGGESLQRNFISHAADALGYPEATDKNGPDKNAEFHRGLYEKRRTAELDFRDLKKTNLTPLFVFMFLFVALVVVFALLVGLASLATEEDFLGEIARTLPGFLVSTGVVAALVAGAKLVLDGANVDVEQSQPSTEEQFAKTFDTLLTRARDEKGYTRIVFFVDELDRCSPDDVVATLTAIKTFLGHDDCIFIVAADREVLETALEALPQASPHDEENPYYSSASSFFDKVFQHQVPLPPLRGRRLTRFARDLVIARGGLWQQIKEAEPRGRLLDRVIYVLIPSHVRSPRRVKVLLNSFATNLRIAESRGVNWRERAPEIAKLTTLQTEFPLLAADLQHAPRLPSLLLGAAPATTSDRVKRLLVRHGGPHKSSDVITSGLEGASATDPPLDADASEAEEARLIETQHQQLRRYLERTADIPDPGRDLLYLEAAGAAFGLEDTALGELLEADAPESPKRVVEEVRKRPRTERIQVLRVLADMCDQEFGDERRNVMTALMGVVEVSDEDISDAGDAVVAALRGFQEEQGLEADHLPGALQVALAVERDDEHPLTAALFEREDLLDTADRVGAVASSLDRIPPAHRALVYQRVAEEFASDPTVLTLPLSELSDDAALELLQSDPVNKVLELGLKTSTQAVELADGLYEATAESPILSAAVQNQAVRYPDAYPSVRDHADAVLPNVSRKVADDHVLIALDFAPPADWIYWVARLSEGAAPTPQQTVWAADAAVSAIADSAAADVSEDDAERVLTALSPFLSDVPGKNVTAIATAVQQVLKDQPWWTDEDTRKAQMRLHGVTRTVLGVSDAALADSVSSELVNDLKRAKAAVDIVVNGTRRTVATLPESLRGLRLMGELLPGEAAAELYDEWRELTPATEGADAHRLTLTLLALASKARKDGVAADLSSLDADRIVTAARKLGEAGAAKVVHYWLQMKPSAADLARSLTDSMVQERQAREDVSRYVQNLEDAQRTELVEAILDAQGAPDWVKLVSEYGVDDETITERLATEAESASSGDEREKRVRLLSAIRPGTSRSQRRVADLIIHLLGTGKKRDFNLALRAVEALGNQHRSADRLKRAFTAAVKNNKFEVPSKAAQALARAGVRLPKKTFTEETYERLKSIWR
jgi:DNA polymerase III delta prime subunit